MDRRGFLKSGALCWAGIAIKQDSLALPQTISQNNVYFSEGDGAIRIGNSLIELGFDLKSNGKLISVIDKASQYHFLRDAASPGSLFRVALRHKKDREIEWIDSRDAGKFQTSRKEQASGITLVLEAGSFPNRNLAVKVEVTLRNSSAHSTWRMSTAGLEAEEAVYQLVCPILSGVMKVGETVPGEALAVPRQGEGYLFRNPYPVVDNLPLRAGIGPDSPEVGSGEIHGIYPGSFSMQFMLYYNDQAGLYVGCHDSKQNVKGFDIGKLANSESFPEMSISHYPSEAMGHDLAIDYDALVGVFLGDWYDGADIYKEWARQQWWCAKKLWDRDIADWMRTGVGVFQMSNYHIPTIKLDHSMAQIADVVNGLSKDIGVPLLALAFNIEADGAWTGPVGFFPPREGEVPFKEAMKRLRQAGNYGFVYIPGGNWYIEISSYSPPFNSWPKFEATGRANATVNSKGEVAIHRIYPGWQSARLCPHMNFSEKTTAALVLGCLERGCTVVQIDNFPIAPEACYSLEHGHPPGYGSWWSEDWNHLLAEVRRQAKEKDPNSALTAEGITENFIPHLDMYDQRAGNMEYFGHWRAGDPMGGETIPIFGYVYSEYIGAYLAAYPECNRPEVLYWTRSLGKCLAQGVVPTGGWYFPEPKELNPITIGFYKKVVRAAARDGWKYLMFGEMLRPPRIQVPKITASYLKWRADFDYLDDANRHVVQDYAVQHSAWRSRDGMIGYFFANVSQEPMEFEVEISSYSTGTGPYDADAVTDGQRTTWLKHVQLPSRQRLQMDPLSVTMVEVKPAS